MHKHLSSNCSLATGHSGCVGCRGTLPEPIAQAYDRQRRSFEALQRAAGTLADVLDRSLPALPEAAAFRMGPSSVSVVQPRVRSPICIAC